MSVAKVFNSILEEGNDVVDTSLKQSVVKDPFISSTRASDQPIHLIQLFQALGQPAANLGGWPLLPVKVPMQKCDKCSRAFCSPINGRRHVRVHHRQKNLDKDTVKSRELLGSFWDKLSEEEAKGIVSFENLTFEGVPGAAIIMNLTSLILRPGIIPLPDCYSSAGAILLDLIQARRTTLLLSAQELFSILDDASEKTFLCGPALSMQKYIFDGEAAKIGLQAKNVIACSSFFLEQQLVKAWLADKDAEALRCQKLLVEEEEAAQRKRAELLESKRQKKLRQKARDTKVEEEKGHLHEELDSRITGSSREQSGNLAASVSQSPVLAEAADQVASSLETPLHLQDAREEVSKADAEVGFHYINQGASQNIKRQQLQRNNHQHPVNGRWKVTSRSHASSRGFHRGLHPPHPQASRTEVERNCEMRDIRVAPTVKTNKVLMESKPDNDEIVKFKVTDGLLQQCSQEEKQELLIGSIPVTIGSRNHLQVREPEAQDNDLALAEHSPSKSNINGKIRKDYNIQFPTNPEPRIAGCEIPNGKSCPQVSASGTEAEGSANLLFSSHVAKEFLARRWKEDISSDHVKLVLFCDRVGWKEAISSDHVKLVLLPEPITDGSPEARKDSPGISDSKKADVLGSAENSIADGVAVAPLPSGNGKANFGVKRAAGLKKRYVPKLRAAT